MENKEKGNMDGLQLRLMTEEDVADVTALEALCFSDAWSEKLVTDLLDSSYDEAWVIVRPDGELAGYINPRFLAGEGELMRVAVKPAHRGKGYSKILMDRMMQSAKEQQVSDLTLEVRAGNAAAIGLYRSYGFAAEAVRKGYYHNPTEDALIMWLHDLPSIPT